MTETTKTTETTEAVKLIKLSRTGERDLVFYGELLAEASSRENRGPGQNRWVEVAVYQADGDALIARVKHKTCWDGESNTYHAWVCASPAKVADAFEEHFGCMPEVVKDVLKAAFEGYVGYEVLAPKGGA